ncbi:branched-chain amino acid transporter permease [Mycobacteroides chelonae]|uniref:branched-chain amino acid transporter permease n=1 Tax=Mycobacteroides chelonae TaxID=1774 RepID=UPI003AAF8017
MPEPAYIAVALVSAVVITFALRALPFAARNAIKNSELAADLGRWIPLGATAILAVYCLSTINLTGPSHGAGPIVGVVTTVGIHLWRRNAVLSIVVGTLACLIITNVGETHLGLIAG